MKTLTLIFALSLLHCGGSADTRSQTTVQTPRDAHASLHEGQPYRADPRLNVYVQGPDPEDYTTNPGMVDEYGMDVVVTNTGNAPVLLDNTQVWFDVWKGNREIECPVDDNKQLVRTPAELAPGHAFTFHADAICTLPTPGEYEVRAYMNIGAEEPTQHLEDHYVGRYFVRRR